MHINTFKTGKAAKAQEWVNHFEHACSFGNLTEQEKA